MGVQRVCDSCGEVIDQDQPFWIVVVTQQVQPVGDTVAGPVPAMTSPSTMFDFHDEHLPDELRPEEV